MSAADSRVQDALHIDDSASVADKQRTSEIEIGWSRDGKKLTLLING